MKKRQLLAGLLTLVLSISSCVQTAGIQALAYESAGLGNTEVLSDDEDSSEVTDMSSSAADADEKEVHPDGGDVEINVSNPSETESSDSITDLEINGSENSEGNASIGDSKENGSEISETGASSETAVQDDDNDSIATNQADPVYTGETIPDNNNTENAVFDVGADPDLKPEEAEEESEEITTVKNAKGYGEIPFDDARGLTLGEYLSGEIILDEGYDGNVYYNCYYFIPDETGVYTFTAYTNQGMWEPLEGTVYDSSYNGLGYGSGDYKPVNVQLYLTAGEKYYWCLTTKSGERYTVYATVNTSDADFILNSVGERNKAVAPKEETILSVNVYSTQSISYQWAVDGNVIEGENASSYSFIPESNCTVICNVLDDQNNVLGSIDYSITIDNRLCAYPEDPERPEIDIYMAPNSTQTLHVNVSAADLEGITYQWYKDWEIINGADTDSLTITADKYARYSCTVHDKYDGTATAYFYVIINNPISFEVEEAVYYDWENARIIVTRKPKETLTIHIHLTADDTVGMRYRFTGGYEDEEHFGTWFNYTGETINFTLKSEDDHVHFTVVDRFDNTFSNDIWIDVDNHFKAIIDGTDETSKYYTVHPGDTLLLKGVVECDVTDKLSFHWCQFTNPSYMFDSYDEEVSLPDITEMEMTVTPTSIREHYHLYVNDGYGNEESLNFFITLDNDLKAYPDGNDEDDNTTNIAIVPDGEAVLNTNVSAYDYENMQYQWYEGEEEIEGETAEQLSYPVSQAGTYSCVVTDKYGYSSTAYFHVSIGEEGDTDGVVITQHPQSAEVLPGEQITMSVVAVGDGLNYQWQWSSDGENWNNCAGSGYNTDTFAFTMKALYNGRRYRCAVSRGDETAYTNAATATMKALEITRNPADAEVQPGGQVTMTVEAEGGNLTYQWQWSSDGETWKNCTSGGYNTDTFAFAMKAAYDGRQYRCKVTRDSETVYSAAATATLKALGIIRNPEDAEVSIGEQVTMTVEADGENLGYQWQWSNDGEIWNNCFAEGYNTDTFAFVMKAAYNGRQYRCKVARDSETEYSAAATASLKALSIIHNPEDASVLEGEEVRMTVEAEGGDLSYQWQWSSNGETWNNCLAAGYDTDTFVFNMKAAYDGRQYRCAVTRGSETEYSQPGTASLKPVEFTLQPADTEAAAGEQVILTVEAEGENLSYQWQWSSEGETWKNCMGASYNTNAFTFTMKALYSGRQYRCMVTRGTQTGYSDAATVTIKQQ